MLDTCRNKHPWEEKERETKTQELHYELQMLRLLDELYYNQYAQSPYKRHRDSLIG